MSNAVLGLFKNTTEAGHALSELKGKGYGSEVSVISKEAGDTKAHTVDESLKDGAVGGAATGAVMVGLATLLAGATSLVIPGLGIAIVGPLATALTTAAAGAVAGGVVGTLVDKGVPDNTAKTYEERINQGETLVYVNVGSDKEAEVMQLMNEYGAHEVNLVK